MVGFVVGQMSFEKVEIPINIVDQADLLSQQANVDDTAGTEPFDAIGVFVVDIGGGIIGSGHCHRRHSRDAEESRCRS